MAGRIDETVRKMDYQHLARQPGATRKIAEFGRDLSLILHIQGEPEPLVRHLASEQITLGRLDTRNLYQVDIDLTRYGAREKGVSRVHAVLYRGEDDVLYLADLDSANGTQLNGHRLAPQDPTPVSAGDEVMLGKLRLHVYFEKPALV